MDNHKQVVKLCGVCGNESAYNDYHIICNPCKVCVAKSSARYYQANRDKKLKKTNYIKRAQKL